MSKFNKISVFVRFFYVSLDPPINHQSIILFSTINILSISLLTSKSEVNDHLIMDNVGTKAENSTFIKK